MFIKIGGFTINTDNINYAEEHANHMTSIYFVGGGNIELSENEAKALWVLLARLDADEAANQ
jgi:hypothetical protein